MTDVSERMWNDTRLSIEAKAVLLYLDSRPVGTDISIMLVRETFRIGADKMKRIMRELLAAGYVKHTDRRRGARSFYTLVDLCADGGAEKRTP